jgi:hypothetical protein
MRRRIILLALLGVSLGLNLILGTGWYLASRLVAVRRPLVARRSPVITNIFRPVRTNLIYRPQLLSWQDIESSDYVTYIENLRNFGCPKTTIRDIIVADVNQLFARRRATGVVSVTHQWWRSEPDPDVLQEAADKVRELENERRSLLTQLLGPHWEGAGDLLAIPDTSITFDGPLLSELAPEIKEAVRDAELRGRERQAAYAQRLLKEGKPLDPAENARLREQTRAELAKLLGPAQLEEYLLRYSHNADKLRDALRGFDATPEEFRNVFRATDRIDAQLQTLAGPTDQDSLKRRQELEKQREQAVEQSLKGERYALYRLNQDPVFQDARDTAERLGAAPESVLPLYQINQATEQERQRVLGDNELSPEEQSQELAAIYQHQMDSLRKLLGEEAFKKLQTTSGK